MDTIDFVLLFIIIIAGYRGYQKGFLVSLLSIVAFFIATVLAFMFLDWGVNFLDNYFDEFTGFLPYLAFVLIFISTAIGISLLARILKRAIDLTLLGSFDNIGGAILGVLIWVFGLSVFIWLTGTVGIEIPQSWTSESLLYSKIEKLAPTAIDGFSQYVPFIKSLFESITERLQPAVP